jgi:hypothetical protein
LPTSVSISPAGSAPTSINVPPAGSSAHSLGAVASFAQMDEPNYVFTSERSEPLPIVSEGFAVERRSLDKNHPFVIERDKSSSVSPRKPRNSLDGHQASARQGQHGPILWNRQSRQNSIEVPPTAADNPPDLTPRGTAYRATSQTGMPMQVRGTSPKPMQAVMAQSMAQSQAGRFSMNSVMLPAAMAPTTPRRAMVSASSPVATDAQRSPMSFTRSSAGSVDFGTSR